MDVKFTDAGTGLEDRHPGDVRLAAVVSRCMLDALGDIYVQGATPELVRQAIHAWQRSLANAETECESRGIGVPAVRIVALVAGQVH